MIGRFLQRSWWTRFLSSQKPTLILTGFTILLAFWGFARLGGVGDSAYNTIRLFNVDLDPVRELDPSRSSLPWQIEAARFLAPIALAYVFLVALAAVLRTQLQSFRVRHFYSEHVVVIGVGKKDSLIARQLRDEGHFRIVGLEIDETAGAISGLRSSGVPVLIGDARDPEVLGQVRPRRAAHIVVSTGDDSTNLQVLGALSKVIPDEARLTTHVIIDSPFLWTSLHRLQFHHGGRMRRIEFICIPDRAAGLLADAAELEEGAGASEETRYVAVSGTGTLAARLVVYLLRSPVFGAVEGISVLVENEAEFQRLESVLVETDPWVLQSGCVKINVMENIDVRYAHPQTTLGFVVGMNESGTLEAVLRMRRQIGTKARIFAGVPHLDSADVINEIGSDFNRTKFVPVVETVEGAHLLHGSAPELIARGRHNIYVRERLAAGETLESNSSLVSWEELPQALREANRRYADGVAAMLAKFGADLVPLEGRSPNELAIDGDMLESMAKSEHDRWCEDLLKDGWQPTDGPKDPERKLHPLLIPWDDLGEPEREKDRESVLALPELLASVGYKLELN